MTNDELKKLINDRIKEIDQYYKNCYLIYEPTPKEIELQKFLDDIWKLRFKETSWNDIYTKKAGIQLAFQDKENLLNHCNKNYSLRKLHPTGKKTTPLWFLIAKLAEYRDYSFFLAPNIYLRTKSSLRNTDYNIAFSNCLFIDIDDTDIGKPVYNCTDNEIMDYLRTRYPILWNLTPKYVLMSGRGLHLYFILDHTNNLLGTQFSNPLRKQHRNLITEMINLFGGDKKCRNYNRLLRVPFSCNTKYNLFTRLIQNNAPKYQYADIEELILPPPTQLSEKKIPAVKPKTSSTKQPDNTKAQTRHDIAIKARKALMTMRKKDLELYCRLHKRDMEGHRSNFFLIYSCTLKSLHYSLQIVRELSTKLNDSLVSPLTENELEKILEQDKIYAFSNDTISNMLDLTQSEMTMMESNFGKEAMKENLKKHSQKQSEIRRAKRESKQQHIREILQATKDATIKELELLLGVSAPTVCRYKKLYLS